MICPNSILLYSSFNSQGTGNMTVPFLGDVPTTFYFDYAGQRQRFDQKTFGGTQTIVEFHNEGVKPVKPK